MDKYLDRAEAGKILAGYLKNYTQYDNVILLALPRGGVPVAYEIARKLNLLLDVFLVRKLGVPWHKELAMGAIASGGTVFLNSTLINDLKIEQESIDQVINQEENELNRRLQIYRENKKYYDFNNKHIILIDDGIATGATMGVAVEAISQQSPSSIVIAVPVAAYSTYKEMTKIVDKVICPMKPKEFYAVGSWYVEFPQTTDTEVLELLQRANTQALKKHGS